MTNRRVALISVTVSLVAAIGWQMALSSANASRSPAAVTPQDSANPTASVTPAWEYRILIFPSNQAGKRVLGDIQRFFGPPPYLEDEINKLTAQGYLVDHFEIDPAPSVTGNEVGYVSRISQIVVLLKRARE